MGTTTTTNTRTNAALAIWGHTGSESKLVAPNAIRLVDPESARDTPRGEFEGYLAVFGNEDSNHDIIEKGAFSKTLRDAAERKLRHRAAWQYPLLWMHHEDQPIGGFDAREDNKGLYVKGRVDLNIEKGQRAFSGMQMGYARQLSIGFDAVKSTKDASGVRHLREVRLWEGSLVVTGYAAHPEAHITATKQRVASSRAARLARAEAVVEQAGARLETHYAEALQAMTEQADALRSYARGHPPRPEEFTEQADFDAAVREWRAATIEQPLREAAAAVEADRRQRAWVQHLRLKAVCGAATVAERQQLADEDARAAFIERNAARELARKAYRALPRR